MNFLAPWIYCNIIIIYIHARESYVLADIFHLQCAVLNVKTISAREQEAIQLHPETFIDFNIVLVCGCVSLGRFVEGIYAENLFIFELLVCFDLCSVLSTGAGCVSLPPAENSRAHSER